MFNMVENVYFPIIPKVCRVRYYINIEDIVSMETKKIQRKHIR